MLTPKGGALPDRRQLLLLRAALLPDRAGASALAAWRQEVVLDDLDLASYRLLPLLWRRLSRSGAEVPDADRLRGAYRQTWTRAHLLLHRAAPVIRALRDRDIPVLVLKGAALAPLFYGDLGTRFMNDVDLLVPTARAREARSVLDSLGWRPGLSLPVSYLESIHALGYQDGRGGDVDLHWHALWECCGADDDGELWSAARPIEIAGHSLLTLSATDHLLHVCAHGLRWCDPPAVHWVVDAYLILTRSADPVDWDRLLRQALGRNLALQLHTALSLLRSELGAEVPDDVLQALAETRPPLWTRLEYRARMAPPALHRGLFLHWCDHLRRSGPTPSWRRLASFPRYLCSAWGVPSVARLPAVAAGKTVRRILGR